MFLHLLFLFFFFFQSSEQTSKPAKNRLEVPIAKKATYFCENLIFEPRWTGRVRSGPFEGGFAFMFFIFVCHFSFFLSKMFLLFLFS